MMETHQRTEFKVKAEELLAKIKELIHEGNVRRIIIKNEQGVTYLEIPVTVGLIGALVAPIFAAIGGGTKSTSGCGRGREINLL